MLELVFSFHFGSIIKYEDTNSKNRSNVFTPPSKTSTRESQIVETWHFLNAQNLIKFVLGKSMILGIC